MKNHGQKSPDSFIIKKIFVSTPFSGFYLRSLHHNQKQNQKNEGEKDYDKKTFNHNTCSSINSGAYRRRSGRMRQPAALGFSRGHGTDGDPGEGRGDLPESKS